MDGDLGFPAAEGVRIGWAALPAALRAAVEDQIGARVVADRTSAGGFSPGLAARLTTADGRDVFVKAVSASVNADSVHIHRREANIAAALPAGAPTARLRWSVEVDDWVALGFDYVAGATPRLPWAEVELDRVLAAITELEAALTPSPLAVEPVGEFFGAALARWCQFEGDAAATEALHPSWRARLDELVEMETRWPALSTGDTLLHLDIRADNVLLTDDDVRFVDWPWAAIGAPWVDLLAFLPSVNMQGGPPPETVWRAHPVAAGVDDEAVDCVLAGLAGMFTRVALLPAPPGLPTLRPFQAASGIVARAWLAQRRGWTDAVGH